jgi:hypothetical protein
VSDINIPTDEVGDFVFKPSLFEQRTSRRVLITLPDMDNLGLSEDAPQVSVEADSDGSNLTITVVSTGPARSREEYDAIIHLMSTAL